MFSPNTAIRWEPHCCFCDTLLDRDSRCDNIHCLYVGLHILLHA